MSLMNYAKGSLLMLAIVFVCAGTVAAQDSLKANPEVRAKKLTEKMKTDLTLSDDQYSKVYDINVKFAQQTETIRNSTDDKLSKVRAIKSANEAKTKDLKAVLTKEQFDKYEEMQKERKEEARKMMKEKRGR
jgi:Spy/CpxP family protein refolding chaperone